MNGTTLKALRLALGFTQEEAANMIGAVSIRTWRYWEDEGRTIPADVILAIRDLIKFKKALIDNSIDQIGHIAGEISDAEIVITYYASLDAWMTQDGAFPVHWKPHCMAMGALAEKYSAIKLIDFDAVEYQAWLDGRNDDSGMRAQWANLQ